MLRPEPYGVRPLDGTRHIDSARGVLVRRLGCYGETVCSIRTECVWLVRPMQRAKAALTITDGNQQRQEVCQPVTRTECACGM
jgi:hypothetical protein